MATIAINGADIYYELHGSGQPLVLIAGYASDHTYWLPVLDYLAKHYQVLIFDNRGVGRTKDTATTLTADLMAQDVMLLCDQLGLVKPHIVGQSMGGTIAQTLAARYPDKINKLAILTSSPKWRTTMLMAFGAFLQMYKDGLDFDLIFSTTIPWTFSAEFLSDDQKVQKLKQLYLSIEYPQSLHDQTRQYHVLQTFDGREQLQSIQAQTLVICGEQDIVTLPNESKFMAVHIPQVQLITLNCAHGITREIPQQLAQLLQYFFT